MRIGHCCNKDGHEAKKQHQRLVEHAYHSKVIGDLGSGGYRLLQFVFLSGIYDQPTTLLPHNPLVGWQCSVWGVGGGGVHLAMVTQ